LLPRDADEHIVIEGFEWAARLLTRDENGKITGIDLAGRLFQRVPAPSD
jgi:hypothetical protein